MAARRANVGSSTSQWVIVIAGLGVVMSLGNGFWSLANPRGDIKELKDDVGKQFAKIENDLKWQFASKDLVNGKIDSIKEENTTYRRGMEALILRIETKANTLDVEIHGTYSPKDAIAQIQARIIELERVIRDTTRQPVPVTQK
jgi:hypothetical protein